MSPRFGPIALGMIRREVNPGDAVTVAMGGVDMPATVAALPFNA